MVAVWLWQTSATQAQVEPQGDSTADDAEPAAEQVAVGEAEAESVDLEVDPDTVAADDAVEEAPLDEAAMAAAWGEVVAEREEVKAKVFEGRIYGFIDAYVEKVADTPARDPNQPSRTIYETNPYEFDVLNAHVMIQGAVYGRYRFFINLAAPGSGSAAEDEALGLRNAWVEAPLIPGYLNVRAGKTYRRFGLYNEILDAVPTFIGIEPPELFDSDHFMLTRTTNLMLFGTAPLGDAVLEYAVTTGNDERSDEAFPLGLDVYVDATSWLRIGTSFYTSGGPAVPTYAVGEGSPKGGVLNWMEEDSYYIVGGYAQVQLESGLIAQAEYWEAHHDATRDADSLALLAESGTLHGRQMSRFFVGGDPAAGARLDGDYVVRTAYLRLGYEIPVGNTAAITPYVQADYYSNPETVAEKSLGGDAEAGITDDGKFQKYTVGMVFRPVPQVALKVDGSGHVQKFNGDTEFYPELRLSFSYLWGIE